MQPMRVYLDACSLQRPLDDRSRPRVNVEAEAVLTVLHMVESGQVELLSSEALQFEIDRIPNMERQARAQEMLRLASQTLELVAPIEAQADSLVQSGLRPLDALHLAFASWAKADYFCTCDDKLLKKAKRLKALAIKVVSPLELIAEIAP
jgi:predicted nucleic acid-binding protein